MVPKKNTGKAPSIQFYVKDFIAEMAGEPPEIVGAWFLVLCQIWHVKRGGSITGTLAQFALIMHTSAPKAQEFIEYFKAQQIANVRYRNGKVTVVNRRTKRDAKLLEQNRLRQQKFRDKRNSNSDITSPSRNPSSSSSSSASTNTPLPPKGERGKSQVTEEWEKL